MLHWRGGKLLAKRDEDLCARCAVIVVDADLDQFVAGETGIDLLDDGFGEAVLAYRDHRIEGMGAGAQGAALV